MKHKTNGERAALVQRIDQAIAEGMDIGAACEREGVNRQTYRRWTERLSMKQTRGAKKKARRTRRRRTTTPPAAARPQGTLARSTTQSLWESVSTFMTDAIKRDSLDAKAVDQVREVLDVIELMIPKRAKFTNGAHVEQVEA